MNDGIGAGDAHFAAMARARTLAFVSRAKIIGARYPLDRAVQGDLQQSPLMANVPGCSSATSTRRSPAARTCIE
jgi:hypothetical protein